MAGNKNLNAAGRAKRDEFYTQLTDIEKEMKNYRDHFFGKVIFCNCDDPFESNFFKYFVLNFNRLGLKKLIATCYSGSPIAGEQLSLFDIDGDEAAKGKPYKAVVTRVYDTTGDGGVNMLDVAELFKSHENELTELKGDGDFRSPECLELLDEADIVVTNPPFSLFREYIATLVEHKKRFIIIGNQNAITYKEVFRLLMNNHIWLGCTSPKELIAPVKVRDRKNTYIRDDGTVIAKFGNICWFTNLDLKKRHEELILVKRYKAEVYPKYQNYNAINVDKTVDIPCDYPGIMGVPISFFGKYNPEQFEIIMMANGNARTNTDLNTLRNVGYVHTDTDKGGLGIVGGKLVYARVLIRNRYPEEPRKV
ncbi:adenine-specific methyltransferase EcoRI family protein [Bifidobacterium asteroides]|uniref:Modification methylase n=1 Tax=Bifidobacterium asteroides TaxID=1684 RepID=A0A318N665_9BIFI|nr:adenine-specific methyltransferase EcoRI family protein [Bifidobacterium asteroides]PXY89732.1 modification methylase [Bifidobacterium asteroides]